MDPKQEAKKAVRERINDGLCLWNANRPEGAFIMGLVALSGLSRIRYPETTSYKVYFQRLREFHPDQLEKTANKERSRDKRKPNMQSGEAFKCTVLDLIGDILLPNPPPGICQPKLNFALPYGPKLERTNIEDILYTDLRNTFIHNAQLTPSFKLTEPMVGGLKLHLSHPLEVTGNFVLNLFNAVAMAPEIRQ